MRIDVVSTVDESPGTDAPPPDELRLMVAYLEERGEPVPPEWIELLNLADEFESSITTTA